MVVLETVLTACYSGTYGCSYDLRLYAYVATRSSVIAELLVMLVKVVLNQVWKVTEGQMHSLDEGHCHQDQGHPSGRYPIEAS